MPHESEKELLVIVQSTKWASEITHECIRRALDKISSKSYPIFTTAQDDVTESTDKEALAFDERQFGLDAMF